MKSLSTTSPRPTPRTPTKNRGGSTRNVTLWLVICVTHSLVGPFLVGYNTSLFNVPEETIRENASQSYIDEIGWEIINAMFPIGALLGAAFSGTIADRFGRKKTILLVSIINIIASAITASSYYYTQLLIGRFITGIACGMATSITSLYLNEISPEHLRGLLGTSLQIMITLSIVVSELLGKIWSTDPLWRYGCALGGMMAIIQLVLGFTLLESPTWLHGKERHSEANSVMHKLRDSDYRNVNRQTMEDEEDDDHFDEEEYRGTSDMTEVPSDYGKGLMQSEQVQKSKASNHPKSESFWKGLREHAVIRRILYISLFVHMLQQLSGINVVFYYSTTVLDDAGFSDPWLGTVLLSVANFLAVLMITPFMDRWGRKNLLFASAVGMAVSAALITVTFVYLDKADDGSKSEEDWGIAMLTCMVLYVASFEIGLGPIPWVIVAEMTPFEYGGAMVAASQVMNYGCNAIIAATSETLLGALDEYGFLPFGCICAAGSVVVFLFVPETMHKTTKQIVDEMDPEFYGKK